MTPRALATGLATAALVAVGGLAAALPASAAPTAPFTALSIRYPLDGDRTGARTYDTIDDVSGIAASPLEGGGIEMAANEGGAFATVTITPPTGAAFAAGQTLPVAATPTATDAAVQLETTGGYCDYTGGTVSIVELTGDSSEISVLAANITGDCATIQARVGATTPWSGLDIPSVADLGEADLLGYTEMDVVVRVTGTSPVTFGSASVKPPTDPDDFPDFDVVDDQCGGSTFVPDGTCTVTVGFSPWYAGERNGLLSIPDTTATGATRVALTGTGTTDSRGSYVGIPTPKRLLDTRTSGTRAPLAKGSTTRLQVAGAGGVPASGASAVVLNLTAVDTTSEGYLTLYPNGVSRPTASSINFPRGWTGANMVTVPLGADGKVALYNYGGAAHAVVDVLGWYWQDTEKPLGSQLIPIGGERLFDSRDEGAALKGGDYVDLDVWPGTPEEIADVTQLVVNITAVGATKPGVLTAWSGEGTRPKASTVNYEPGVIAPNMAVVQAGHGGGAAGFRISNTTSGSVHVVVDLVGVHFANSPIGLRFNPRATPTRILDTREALGLSGAFGAGQTRTVNASSVANVDTYGVVANTTGIKPTRQTYLSTWSGESGTQRPEASLLNVKAGLIRSASTYAFTTETQRFKLYNNAGSMHVAMDVAGTFDFYPSSDIMGPVGAPTATRSDAGSLPTVRGFGGRVLRPTVTVDDVRATVTHR